MEIHTRWINGINTGDNSIQYIEVSQANTKLHNYDRNPNLIDKEFIASLTSQIYNIYGLIVITEIVIHFKHDWVNNSCFYSSLFIVWHSICQTVGT